MAERRKNGILIGKGGERHQKNTQMVVSAAGADWSSALLAAALGTPADRNIFFPFPFSGGIRTAGSAGGGVPAVFDGMSCNTGAAAVHSAADSVDPPPEKECRPPTDAGKEQPGLGLGAVIGLFDVYADAWGEFLSFAGVSANGY